MTAFGGTRLVVKVGGSLYDLPDLGTRLRDYLADQPEPEVLLVPGGGGLADAVRALDRCHGLGEERAHWLALRTLTVAAWFLADLLPGAVVVDDIPAGIAPYPHACLFILDPHAFCLADERRHGRAVLPHAWAATSDSLAVHVAQAARAHRLVLLKSTDVPPGLDWHEAGLRGLVDPLFATLLTGTLLVEAVNLRR